MKPKPAAALKVDTGEKDKTPTQTGAACIEMETRPDSEVVIGEPTTTDGHAFPIVSAAYTIEPSIPVRKGVVVDQPVIVLRDTGCSTVVVRKDIVADHQLTGRIQPCILLDGTVPRVPVASIAVDTPFLTGEVQALCMENPLYDLIIGNVTGARIHRDQMRCGNLRRD